MISTAAAASLSSHNGEKYVKWDINTFPHIPRFYIQMAYMASSMKSITLARETKHRKDDACGTAVIWRLWFNQIRAPDCETNPKLHIIYLDMRVQGRLLMA